MDRENLEDAKLGATGKFPAGKMHPDDEGELVFRIGVDRHQRKVVVDFGKPVMSLGMDPDDADALAASLVKQAKVARGC